MKSNPLLVLSLHRQWLSFLLFSLPFFAHAQAGRHETTKIGAWHVTGLRVTCSVEDERGMKYVSITARDADAVNIVVIFCAASRITALTDLIDASILETSKEADAHGTKDVTVGAWDGRPMRGGALSIGYHQHDHSRQMFIRFSDEYQINSVSASPTAAELRALEELLNNAAKSAAAA